MAATEVSREALKGVTQRRWVGGVGAALILPGVVGLFAGIDALRASPAQTVAGVLCLGGFVASLALAGAVSKLFSGEVLIDAEGIESRFRLGESVRIRWSEPHDLFYRGIRAGPFPVIRSVSVRAPDGRRVDVEAVRIPGGPNADLPAIVEQRSTAANWPKIADQLRAGQEVEFGPVRMSRERIRVGLLEHAVSPALKLDVANGRIQVRGEGRWLASQVWVRQVPNYPSLLRAIDDAAATAAPARG